MVGAAPAVDRLVVVAHDAEVPVLAGDRLDDLVLRSVRVLVLVDEHVAVLLAQLFDRSALLLQDADGVEQDVVEVERARARELLLVARPDPSDQLVDVVRGRLEERRGVLQTTLRERDAREHLCGLQRDVAHGDLAQRLAQDRHLVPAVGDGEAPDSDGLSVRAQEVDTERVERADEDPLRELLADEARQPFPHLARGLVREGHREDRLGRDPLALQQVGDPDRDDARLAGPGAGEHEERTLRGGDGAVLFRVEVCDGLHATSDGGGAAYACSMRVQARSSSSCGNSGVPCARKRVASPPFVSVPELGVHACIGAR